MNDSVSGQQMKRNIAYKLRIGDILSGNQVNEDERFRYLDIAGKRVVRVNLIANVVDKFLQEGEKKYGTFTLDDGSGQVRAKLFGDDVDKFSDLQQGDTVLCIGLLRSWNNEVYINPEIIRKKEPTFLLIRKLEAEAEQPKVLDKGEATEIKNKILEMIKKADGEGGIDIDKVIMDMKEQPEVINGEIKKLLEDGLAYEPRPGKLRYLG